MTTDSQLLAWVAAEVQAMQQPGRFGTITVRVHDGKVVLVETTEQKKPTIDAALKKA